MTSSKRKRHNPEKRIFRGRSYRKGGRCIAAVRDASRLSSDRGAY